MSRRVCHSVTLTERLLTARENRTKAIFEEIYTTACDTCCFLRKDTANSMIARLIASSVVPKGCGNPVPRMAPCSKHEPARQVRKSCWVAGAHESRCFFCNLQGAARGSARALLFRTDRIVCLRCHPRSPITVGATAPKEDRPCWVDPSSFGASPDYGSSSLIITLAVALPNTALVARRTDTKKYSDPSVTASFTIAIY